MPQKVKVLIADDSPTTLQLLTHLVNAAPDLEVVGQAQNGKQVVYLTGKLQPDVILMDVIMPQMDGLEATRIIMQETPTPIVVISANLDDQETDFAFQAMRSGALNVLRKPSGPNAPGYAAEAARLQNTLRAMAGVRVIHHRQRKEPTGPLVPTIRSDPPTADRPEIVAIAASTGGPAALSEILKRLPPDFALPIVIVQHIAPDFIASMINWLGKITPLEMTIAQDGGRPQPGTVYLAPDRAHLLLDRRHRFFLDRSPTKALHVPSGDVLFRSIAEHYGAQAIGVILTGMGEDGVHGLRQMYEAGAYTIAQDKATSVVYGMPGEAARLGAVRQELPLKQIAGALIQLSNRGANHARNTTDSTGGR
jgi:two-component system chemotaxis response regulator CheB